MTSEIRIDSFVTASPSFGPGQYHLPCYTGPETRMIRLDSVSKQHGPRILFVDAAAAIHRGEKVGLVGPNGAGKSTIFRLIMREESPDDGQVSIDRGVTIGYFSQDVGEMSGRSAVAETMDGAGAVAEVATELRELELALADPTRAGELDRLVARFGDVQARYDELGGYALGARAGGDPARRRLFAAEA